MRTRGSCKTHEEKRRKKFVGQPLGVTLKSSLTPKSWLLIWKIVVLILFLHNPLMCVKPIFIYLKKVLFNDFWMFFIVFDHANACASMHSLVEIHNTGPTWKIVITTSPGSKPKGKTLDQRFASRIKALLLRRNINNFGDAFGELGLPQRSSTAASAIEHAAVEKPLLLRPFSIAAAAVEERRSRRAKLCTVFYCSSSIAALTKLHSMYSKFFQFYN